jgi:hypothetical protein
VGVVGAVAIDTGVVAVDVSMVVNVVVGVVEANPHRDDAVIMAIRVSERQRCQLGVRRPVVETMVAVF